MYSAFYRYISIYPSENHSTLPTALIESTIDSFGVFLKKEKGRFINCEDVITMVEIQLMKVSDHNSWSEENFDSGETNYVNVTISRNKTEENLIIGYLIGVANKLQWILFEEDDDEGILLFSPNKSID